MKKLILLLAVSSSLFLSSCKEKEIVPQSQTVTGKLAVTQTSFTPYVFDNGKPIKAKIVQINDVTLTQIGRIVGTVNVDFDLVQNKSGEVIIGYTDTIGDRIFTTSSSVASATGLTITEKIIGGTGKFSKITGGGTYFIALNFQTGNGTGDFSWTVTY